MERVKIKNKAREMIKGNLWYFWKPLLVYLGIAFIIGVIIAILAFISGTAAKVVGGLLDILLSLISAVLAVWYAHYVLSFVRGKKIETINYKDVIDFVGKHWLKALAVSVVVGLNVMFGTILLIVPGIMASIGLMFFQEVQADNLDLSTKEILKKSWKITNGYKMDLFVMGLSFIGWSILAVLTLGILYIWLAPYMLVSFTLVYEKLRTTNK